MPGKSIRILLPVLALIAGIAVSACGTVATPEWAAEAQSTRAALAATSEHLTAIAPTATPTSAPTETPIPPTATPVPPTATSVPPTETPIPPTAAAAATEAPAAQHDEHAAPDDNAKAIEAALAAGNVENGMAVFTAQHTTASGNWACSTCHSVSPDGARIIGPGLWNVSIHGPGHVEGQTAVDYIHQSIVDPSAYIVPEYPDNLMPKDWGTVLTEQELNDVIAYLLTLHD